MGINKTFLDELRTGRATFVAKYVAANVTLGLQDNNVQADMSQTFTITLPAVQEANGKIFSIRADGAAGSVTVTHAGDSMDWGGDYTLDTTGDRVVLYSDGRSWIPVFTEIT